MKSVSDVFNGFLRFVGLLDDYTPQRKNIKRNRVSDDFTSDDDDDDETPVIVQQPKKFRWSDLESIDKNDKGGKHRRSVRIVPIHRTSSPYIKSTPQMSSEKTVPLKKTTPVIDADLDQEDPDVAKVESASKNTRNKQCILKVDLDEDDNDEVVFVKEVATPRTNPLKHSQAKNSHASDVKDKFLSTLSEAIKSDDLYEYRELLQLIENTIMSKEKPFDDSNLVGDMASFSTLQKAQINVHDDDRHQNAPQVSLIDSSDSDDDVELVAPAPTPTSSIKTNAAKTLEELSKKWLLELDTIYNKNHQDNKVNSEQNKACSDGHDVTDGSDDLLTKLVSTYNITELYNKPKIQKTQEKHIDSRRASDIIPIENSEQNEAGSSKRETVGDRLAKIDAKYFRTPRKTPDKLDVHLESNIRSNISEQNEAHLHKLRDARDRLLKLQCKKRSPAPEKPDAPQVDTVQKEPHASPLESTKEYLKSLDAKYFPTQGILSDLRRESDIVRKVNGEKNGVRSITLDHSGVSPLRKGSEYETDLLKTQEKHDRESDTSKAISDKNEACTYLPAASRDWLAQLKAQYETPPQNNQVSLNMARQKLSNISKENSKPSEIRSGQLDSTDDWVEELRAKYNKVQRNRHEELNDARRKLSYENKPTTSHKLDTTEDRPSLTSKHKTEQKNTQANYKNTHEEVTYLPKLNSEQKEAFSFKFNTSEELMSKLGSLYDKYQQETDNISNKSVEESALESQSSDLPVLTPQQEEMVDEAFEPEPEDELLMERFNMRIHRRDILTLSGLNWLNDEVINFYMNLIMQRSEERNDLPRVYATNTFFYPKLMQSGQAGLRRWTRKVDIFAYDLFMVPVNIGHHWCLSIVDFRSRVIKYLDSRGIPNEECLDALLQYLKDEHREKKGEPFDAKGWKMECITGIPQQMNGSDCGMFACTFAEFTSRDAPYSFTQAHMPYLRRKAALEILMGKLLL